MDRIRISKISLLHYTKLVFRSILLICAIISYIIDRQKGIIIPLQNLEQKPIILNVIWIIFVIEMIFRFFPSRLESMGCQKQFARNFISTEKIKPIRQSRKIVFLVAALWLLLNAIFGILYYLKCIDAGILIIICLVFSVCDMICILFYCPFQTIFLKNKCCGTCRIYNWDYAMMFTPLIYVKSYYSWSLLGIALLLLFVWEHLHHKHPERFYETTNANLSCANCKEKLCHHKKQLRYFWNHNGRFISHKADSLKQGDV